MRIMCLLMCALLAAPLSARVITVGPEGEFARPSQAARVVRPGDVVEIDARGDYRGDVAVWRVDRITLRGVNGRPELVADGRSAQGKGIWVIRGRDVVVENIAFIGARVPDKNGAGIRFERGSLTVRRCLFRDNENGILTAGGDDMRLRVEASEFIDNGAGDGYTHHLYAGRMARLEVIGSRFLRARIGHHIKSRARYSLIAYNRIEDGREGRSSYLIDLSEGGEGWVIGNLLVQGMGAENRTLVAFALEGRRGVASLFFLNNTLVNQRRWGIYLRLGEGSLAWVINNIFAGRGRLTKGGEVVERRNLSYPVLPGFVDPREGDFRLRPGSRAIDQGEPWFDTLPDNPGLCCQPPGPGDPPGAVPRPRHGPPDVGAWESETALPSPRLRLP